MDDDDVLLSRGISLQAKGLYALMRAMEARSSQGLSVGSLIDAAGGDAQTVRTCLHELGGAGAIVMRDGRLLDGELADSGIALVAGSGERFEGRSIDDRGRAAFADAYPADFNELCELSLRPIEAASFRADCYVLWRKRIDEGYAPGQIKEAYAAYASAYRARNGSDARYAKNLASWLMRSGGLDAFAGTPATCRVVEPDGRPLSRQRLADVFERFRRAYSNERSIRASICSDLASRGIELDEESISAELARSEQYGRYADRCDAIYEDYLRTVDPDDAWGLRADEAARESEREMLAALDMPPKGLREQRESATCNARFDDLADKLARSLSASEHANESQLRKRRTERACAIG